MMSPFDSKNRVATALDRLALRVLLFLLSVGYFFALWHSGAPSLLAGSALFALAMLTLLLLERRTLARRDRALRVRVGGAIALEELMLLGILGENEPLPSVRSLAMELSINPNTIQRAYAELERQGYIYTVKGKGSFVAENSVMKEKRKKDLLIQVSEVIDEAIRLGISGEEIKNMVEIQYQAAEKEGGDRT